MAGLHALSHVISAFIYIDFDVPFLELEFLQLEFCVKLNFQIIKFGVIFAWLSH